MFPSISPLRSAFAPVLVNEPIYLRRPSKADFKNWLDLRQQSLAHLTVWEQKWEAKDITAAKYRQRLRFFEKTAKNASGLSLFIFQQQEHSLVGGLSLTNIRYGAARSATLGYWIGAPYLRKGYARAAIKAVLPHLFETLKLNRVEAACQAGNIASKQLLLTAGFSLEGTAAEYLKINGAWRDHELFGMTAGAFKKRNTQVLREVE